MSAVRYYDNPKRLGEPFLYRDCVLVEHEAGRFNQDASQLSEFVSCVHVPSPTPGAYFGGGMCFNCTRLLEENSQDLEDQLVKAGWKQ